jgi:hypothetical protein
MQPRTRVGPTTIAGQGVSLCCDFTCRRDNKSIKFEDLVDDLTHVYHTKQAATLSMVCERYACRHTPAFAALCLPTHTLVPRLFECWTSLNGSPPPDTLLNVDPGT